MASHVHYAEGRGDDALATLRRFLDTLPRQPGFVSAELLWSEAQPGLYLVMSRWEGRVPSLDLAPGLRGWTFETVDSR
ncbi:heme-degrading monooxygenase HmoA [Deinococcus metalli]|uniref:Heme-degrading monooxygenase HmoA n=1 Tax=Deinococcus metalli TaxID=1141878 RepID=A0A7W8KFI4_9DEIO|nr:antibiotic biosynthesis monooxygenase [Deinococcus metalli]MBB5376066.1 heme-degrading monooxygenase HmoA [Deinococcus metalli]GHF41062.1 hypothetical protein GCM10017781_17170 [Deinococcus metalli]